MRLYFLLLLLLYSSVAISQSLAQLEEQLDSLLNKQQKSEIMAGISLANNPAYGNKTANYELPIVLKTFVAPFLSYYHKNGFYSNISAYCFLNSSHPWFEWDLTAGYDYTKNKSMVAGVSYTRFTFNDSSDVPTTPIKNELYAYFYYRKWWLQPGISLDYGWGQHVSEGQHTRENLRGSDINTTIAVRHPFTFPAVMYRHDLFVFMPVVDFTMGTANYYSNLKIFQYVTRYTKLSSIHKHPGKELNFADHTDFEPRAIDFTVNASYLIGRLNLAPSFSVFKTFSGMEQGLMSYFNAKMAYSF